MDILDEYMDQVVRKDMTFAKSLDTLVSGEYIMIDKVSKNAEAYLNPGPHLVVEVYRGECFSNCPSFYAKQHCNNLFIKVLINKRDPYNSYIKTAIICGSAFRANPYDKKE